MYWAACRPPSNFHYLHTYFLLGKRSLESNTSQNNTNTASGSKSTKRASKKMRIPSCSDLWSQPDYRRWRVARTHPTIQIQWIFGDMTISIHQHQRSHIIHRHHTGRREIRIAGLSFVLWNWSTSHILLYRPCPSISEILSDSSLSISKNATMFSVVYIQFGTRQRYS